MGRIPSYTQDWTSLSRKQTMGVGVSQVWKALLLNITNQQSFIVSPFGKKEPVREDLAETRLGKEYWDWSEDQVKMYS